jgi:hypothetical protein
MAHIFYKIETERESDGRWIADVLGVPGILAYGSTQKKAVASAQVLALRILTESGDTISFETSGQNMRK